MCFVTCRFIFNCLENNISLVKLKLKQMKKVIEKIEKIKGVEKVTETGSNELTVQVEKKNQAVECTNKEQWNFIARKTQLIKSFRNGLSIAIGSKEYTNTDWYKRHSNWCVISFSEYLSEYNLKDEWEKYLIGEAEKRGFENNWIMCIEGETGSKSMKLNNKFRYDPLNNRIMCELNHSSYTVWKNGDWATIIEPELELVSGEIYYDKDGYYSSIFRCKNKELYYSRLMIDYNKYCLSGSIVVSKLKPATNKQKAKLIKAELKHGYLWNGKELVKYK